MNAYIAHAGMQIINEIGVTAIRAWLETLAWRLIEGGRARGLELHGTDDVARRTATMAFVVPDSHAVGPAPELPVAVAYRGCDGAGPPCRSGRSSRRPPARCSTGTGRKPTAGASRGPWRGCPPSSTRRERGMFSPPDSDPQP